jgi:glyceraldehyde 3-phosphate dehydrogenase
VTDFVANIKKSATADEINAAYKHAAENGLKGIMEYSEDPLVSSDIVKNSHSSIIDALSTMMVGDNMVKVVGWYDNEWGYSCRTADLAAFLVDKVL